MNSAVLRRPVRNDDDIERLLLSRVRDDPRPYSERATYAGHAVTALLARLGNPHQQLRCIHIAGSKGKGSVALMAEHLLHRAGYRTGTFTSPHLRRWNERIRVAATDIDSASFAHALDTLRPHLAALDQQSDTLSPGFFDVLTAAALLTFARESCDAVVLETGLGGRFDATNIIAPLATCITSIELEHTDKLGDTLAAIAEHKAGIIKPDTALTTTLYDTDSQRVIADRATALGAREWRLGRDWHIERSAAEDGSQRVRYRRAASDENDALAVEFTLPHPSEHMAINAGLAVTLIATAGWCVDARELSGCSLPGRGQVLRECPLIIVDSAHTPASLRALRETLAARPAGERRFVVSASRGKSIRALAELIAEADSVWVTRADRSRSAPADEIAAALADASDAALLPLTTHVVDDPAQAFAQAAGDLPRNGVLCVCGSVYLAGAALRWWANAA